MEIRELKRKDIKIAIRSAVKGMHFDWYMDDSISLWLYGHYFWYLETNRASECIAVYEGDQLAGVLLVEIYGEKPEHYSKLKSVYVRLFDFLQQKLFPDGAGAYDQVNRELYAAYCRNHQPDGEIIFLAANPDLPIKGVGTVLLNELQKRQKGKEVFLFTDNACTYQFYEHRGFTREGEKDIVLELGRKRVPLTCLLYRKVL